MSEGQEYYPYKKTGIALHLLLVLVLLGGIGFLLFLVFSRPAGWPLAIYLLVTLLLLALLPLIAYRGYALYRALYVIERDGLRVRWGLRSEDLPLTEVLWVRPASDLITPLTLPKFSMPGAILGTSSHKELGELEFIASKTADLVIVAAVEKTLVLSPQDPEEFSRRFQRVIEMGSLAPIAPHTTIPAAYMQSVFQDQLAKTLLAISILLTLLFLIVTSILIPFRSMVSIGYDFNAVSLPAVPANRLLMLPILALFFMVVNVISGFFFYRRKETRTITYFVWAAGILTPLLLFVSVLLIFLTLFRSEMPQPFQTLLGVLLAAVVAYAAYRMRSLNLSGGLAAFLLGSIVFGLGGLPWAVLLLLFFITSTGLSFQLKKKNTVGDQYAKGSQRDAWQVGANGGIAGVMVILHGLHPTSPLPWALFAAALAAANADTWATEVGAMSESWPRKITTLKPVPPGTSGGVSAVGTLAAAAGSLVIALGAVYLWPHSVDGRTDGWGYAAIIFLAGFLGSLLDSLLGATVQQIYWCPDCEKETEKSPVHSCGSPTVRLRGWRWLNNDVINLACTLSATVTALILTRIV